MRATRLDGLVDGLLNFESPAGFGARCRSFGTRKFPGVGVRLPFLAWSVDLPGARARRDVVGSGSG